MSQVDIDFQKLLTQKQFRLGHLNTEKNHYLTKNLSELCHSDLSLALERLKQVDNLALIRLEKYAQKLDILKDSIKETFRCGKKVYLCGCGATGRLALTLETLFRKSFPSHQNQIVSFMAGGDYALIKSVESFEDNAEYGARQLLELGFQEGDLLISSSEGGETNFVIGATQKAATLSRNKPYFLFCNPKDQLKNIKRSFDLINNKSIISFSLSIGSMALSGSTRMQATTCLLLFIGIPLLNFQMNSSSLKELFHVYILNLKKINYNKLESLIHKEYACYQQGSIINYIANPDHAISILTDTTERSPTFSLNAFESLIDNHRSLAYLIVDTTDSAKVAWQKMLGREPRGLSWKDIKSPLTKKEIYQFDISNHAKIRREQFSAKSFNIIKYHSKLVFQLDSAYVPFSVNIQDPLYEHLMIKLLLNAHSTTLMGKMGRYSSNVMTWVKPSNLKLIDRSIRYIDLLLKDQGQSIGYEEILKRIIKLKSSVSENEPIVLKVLNSFINNPY